MEKPNFKYDFKIRTLLYLFIGITCVSIDFISFIKLSEIINPFYANPISYLLGSVCSFCLNKKFTFKSKNSDLSFFRYAFVITIGLFSSQIVILIGNHLLGLKNNLVIIKYIAMATSVSLQYFGNTIFGSKLNIKDG